MNLKKLICSIVAVATLLQPLTASAVNLGEAFNSLLTNNGASHINGAGRYQSASRTGFSAGGFQLRVPRTTNVPQLFSVTPPTVEAGCNGISAHFGGFSFISGKEFEQLLRGIASGAALGFVASLTMKLLCPSCQAIVNELKTAAQTASEWSKNSCEIGKKAGEAFMNGLGIPDSFSLCANTSAKEGESNDALSAYQSVCNTLGDATKKMQSFNKATAGTDEEKEAKAKQTSCLIATGNLTWYRINSFDSGGKGEIDSDTNFYKKLVLMNIMGAEMGFSPNPISDNAGVASCEQGDGTVWPGSIKFNGPVSEFVGPIPQNPEVHYCAPPLDTDLLVGHYMCGSPSQLANNSNGMSEALKSYCSAYFPASKTGSPTSTAKVWTCNGAEDGNLAVRTASRVHCSTLVLTDADNVFKGQGLLQQISTLLREGANRVRNNQSFQTDEQGKRIIALIQSAPYPLYQAINAAAVYPSAAEDLLDSISVLVAEQYAYALFDEQLRVAGQSSSAVCISPQEATTTMDFLSKLRNTNYARRQQISQNFTVQQALTEQIRQMNLAIQRQVISAEMLNNAQMGQSVNKAINRAIN